MTDNQWGYVTIGGAVIIIGYMVIKRAGIVADEVITETLNPMNSKNIANTTVTRIGENISGQSGWSLGGWIYDVFNPNQPDPTAPTYYQPSLNVDYLP